MCTYVSLDRQNSRLAFETLQYLNICAMYSRLKKNRSEFTEKAQSRLKGLQKL